MKKEWDTLSETPLVSVCILAYKHEPYIQQCIDGALNQDTEFPCEICIGEDESPDGTRDKCKEYAVRYPEIIRLFLRSRKDVITVDGFPTGRFNFLETLKSCRGKYIALCEGDDYWCDSTKLNKQVEFMESNSDYLMCHTDYDYQNDVNGYTINNFMQSLHHQHDVEDGIAPMILSQQYLIRTATVLLRADTLFSVLEEYADDFGDRFRMADLPLFFHMARKGKIKYFEESTAVYRRVPNSSTSVNNFKNRYSFIRNAYGFASSFIERFGYTEVQSLIERNYLNQLVRLAILSNEPKEAKQYARMLTSQSLWNRGSSWVQLSATYAGFFALFYRQLVRFLFWCEPKTGNLGGRLRVLISKLRNG